MALIHISYCHFCEKQTSWCLRDSNMCESCVACGNSWSTVQKAIDKREADRVTMRRAIETGKLAGKVDFVTMAPMRETARKLPRAARSVRKGK